MLAGGTAAEAAQPNLVAEVEFSDLFLRQADGTRIDVARFSKGNAALPGTYRAELYVNEMWIGRAELALREVDGDPHHVQPCMDRELLERMGVDLNKLTPQAVARMQAAQACVPLAALVKDGRAFFDNGEQRLDVMLPQAAMTRQARGYVDPKFWDDGVTSARVQYNANLYHAENLGASSTQGYVGLAAGMNVGPWRFRHTGNLTRDDVTGNRYQSVQTNVQRAVASIRSQLLFGDAFTDGTLFDSVGFRGVRLASDDRMYPESQRGYAPTIRGIANSNARVQIRQGGNILYETTVAAGAFEIDDLYPTGYGGDLEVVVTEADGSVRVSKVPYAAAVNALRPGITRYSVTAGQYRNPGASISPWLMQATVQHGLTNLLTGYGGVVLAQGYFAAMAGAALNTDYGAFGFDVTQANTSGLHEASRNGQSYRATYSKHVAPTSTNLTLAAYRYSTEGYASLADAMTMRDFDARGISAGLYGRQRGRLQLTVNQSLPQGYGNVYLSGSTQNYWNRSGTDLQYQVGYSNSAGRVTYGVTGSRQLNINTGRWETRVMLNVGVPLGRSPRTPYSMTSVQRDSSGVTTLQEAVTGTLGEDAAFAYGINATRTGGGVAPGDTSLGANATYVSPLATVSGTASKSRNYTQISAGLAGGIVAYAGGMAFTPTPGETMAVVEAKDAAGARIANASGLRVDPWGHAVVPNLMPFSRNQVEIDPKGLPMSVELESTLQTVTPTAGALVKLKFDTENAGRTTIVRATRADGKPLPFGAQVFGPDGQAVGTVAQGGRVLVRGLKAGHGTLRVSLDGNGGECLLQYQMPAGAQGNADGFDRMDAMCR